MIRTGLVIILRIITDESNAREWRSEMNNDNCWSGKKRYCVDIAQRFIATWPSCFSANRHEKLRLIKINGCMQTILHWRSFSYSCTFSSNTSREIYYIKGYSRCASQIFILCRHSFLSSIHSFRSAIFSSVHHWYRGIHCWHVLRCKL